MMLGSASIDEVNKEGKSKSSADGKYSSLFFNPFFYEYFLFFPNSHNYSY